jgi:hypothetical protein
MYNFIGSREEALQVIRAIGERDRLIADLRKALADLQNMPEYDGTVETSRKRLEIKRAARALTRG